MAENDLFQINSILLKEDNKQQFDIYSKLIRLSNKKQRILSSQFLPLHVD